MFASCLKPGNWILYRNPPKYTFKARIEDTDSTRKILEESSRRLPDQTPYLQSLVIRKKLMDMEIICNKTIDMAAYAAAWQRGILTYQESFAAERHVMGLGLAEIYIDFMRLPPEKEPQRELEKAISGLCFYRVRREDDTLFPSFDSFLEYINEDVKRTDIETLEARENSAIQLTEAMALLLTKSPLPLGTG